jgi:hypothetical protein
MKGGKEIEVDLMLPPRDGFGKNDRNSKAGMYHE